MAACGSRCVRQQQTASGEAGSGRSEQHAVARAAGRVEAEQLRRECPQRPAERCGGPLRRSRRAARARTGARRRLEESALEPPE